MSDVAALEASFERLRMEDDPDQWAMAAYRLAVAKSELASRPGDLDEALDLLAKASRVLTAGRAPVEHSRILTVAASCHRAAGRSDRALELFEQAADLATSRAALAERAGAYVNIGLIHGEAGRPDRAIESLDIAIDMLGPAATDEDTRLLGAALVNRAQAHQAAGDDDSLEAAIVDYRRAVSVLPAESPQAAMAWHGLGTALVERAARDPRTPLEEALAAFGHALAVFGPVSYPFQHAIAKHSLAIAFERRRAPGDLARALDCLEASLSVFDPRLHGPQWQTAVDALGRVERALDDTEGRHSRIEHLARFLARTNEDERRAILRERLRRIAIQPTPRVDIELGALTAALVDLAPEDFDVVLRSFIAVLMELPDRVLEAAATGLCQANRAAPDARERDRALDDAIHDTLFGPQRVRVRDLLEANGWVRP